MFFSKILKNKNQPKLLLTTLNKIHVFRGFVGESALGLRFWLPSCSNLLGLRSLGGLKKSSTMLPNPGLYHGPIPDCVMSVLYLQILNLLDVSRIEKWPSSGFEAGWLAALWPSIWRRNPDGNWDREETSFPGEMGPWAHHQRLVSFEPSGSGTGCTMEQMLSLLPQFHRHVILRHARGMVLWWFRPHKCYILEF